MTPERLPARAVAAEPRCSLTEAGGRGRSSWKGIARPTRRRPSPHPRSRAWGVQDAVHAGGRGPAGSARRCTRPLSRVRQFDGQRPRSPSACDSRPVSDRRRARPRMKASSNPTVSNGAVLEVDDEVVRPGRRPGWRPFVVGERAGVGVVDRVACLEQVDAAIDALRGRRSCDQPSLIIGCQRLSFGARQHVRIDRAAGPPSTEDGRDLPAHRGAVWPPASSARSPMRRAAWP